MRIAIVAYGTRGDVQPLIHLAHTLKAAGYEVRFAAQEIFAAWIKAEGLDYWPAYGNSRTVLDTQAGRSLFQMRNPLRFYRAFQEVMGPLMTHLLSDCLELCRGADLLLYGMGAFVAPYAAEALGIPAVPVTLLPVSRSRLQPSELVSMRSLGPQLNLATHLVVEHAVWQPLMPIANRLRLGLGLKPWPRSGQMAQHYLGRAPILCGFSPTVYPLPADWPPWHEVTGYWLPPEAPGYEPPSELKAFLAAGPKPVYIGFGSMKDNDPVGLTKTIARVASTSRQRFVLHRGWAGLGGFELPGTICQVDYVPHHWLFPRMAAVVHHGGAGTTAAALAAGVPSVVIPFGLDQPFWGRRLERLGAGKVLARGKVDAKRLGAAIQECTTPSLQLAAADLKQRLAAEDGLAKALAFVQKLAPLPS